MIPRLALIGLLLLAAIPALAQEGPSAALPELSSYYALATNAQNAVADTNHGVLVGNARFEDRALVLNGEDSYVNFGSAFQVEGDFSLSLWACPSTNDRLMRVLGRFSSPGNKDYCLFLNCGNRLWAFFSDDGTAGEGHAFLKTTLLPACPAGEWHHLAMTWDAANGPAGLTLYSDGVPLATTNAQLSEIRALHVGEADLTLGAYDVHAALTNSFQGSLSQLVLFRGVLTDMEVQDIRDQGRTANLLPYLSTYLPDPSTSLRTGARSASGPNNEPRTKNSELSNLEPSSVNPRVIYVDCNTGDDEFDGAHPSVVDRGQKRGPKKSMNAAIRAANDGDTVYVAGGIYREDVRNSKVTMIAVGDVVCK